MLSVLHVLTSLKLGGAERVAIELAQIQREQGLNAQILSLSSGTDFLVQVVREKGIPLTISDNTGLRLSRLYQIQRLFRQFDVIHLHSPRSLHYLAPLLLLNSGRRFIYTRHGLDPLKGFYWHALHALLKPFIARVTFVTQSGYDVFQKNYNWRPDKMCVIENGVYIPEQYRISAALPLRFGSVGRMVELKGQKLLLKALQGMAGKELSAENFVLHFYGSGPLEPELREVAAVIAGDNIVFHGEVTDIASIYDNIDVLIVASETEGLSMVIIEAMARGIPVIATAVGGNPTLVKQDDTGILVEYGNLPAMQNAIRLFCSNPELARIYGARARESIKQKFSLTQTSQAFLACYQR